MALDVSGVHHRAAIVELVGTSTSPSSPRPSTSEDITRMVRLRTDLAERDRRIAVLSVGLRVWRERAMTEAAARRREAHEGHLRERELVSLLHQQMQVADSATEELERIRARNWWQRLRG